MCVFRQRGKQIDPPPASKPRRETTFADRVQVGMDDDGAPYRVAPTTTSRPSRETTNQ
jgi:hypothetical protein